MKGVVLFAHGARDARWAEPFAAVRERVAARLAPVPVELAFLELMSPTLETVVDALVARGCDAIDVVPVFLGQGGHLRRDLPERVERVRARHPALNVRVATAAGEDDAVLAAIADHAVRFSAGT